MLHYEDIPGEDVNLLIIRVLLSRLYGIGPIVLLIQKKILHTTIPQECTGHRDIGHTCTLHDLKLLLLRFARGRTFHDDTGGGGPLSNMQLVPALIHMALYVINT